MYTINEVADICDISPHTIRYYDKEGLLPFVSRNETGRRQFSDTDLNVIKLICCFKNSGMQIKNIKKYIDLTMQGAETSAERKEMMINHKKNINSQMADLKKNLNIIDLKIASFDSINSFSLAQLFDDQNK
ncbi:DNA-binding transcriptional regulator, MerR family [Amphibacillus marinus]|uniref:DNA-binding transcriptional regulator, MerR family n=1 Tax=Amphibacillus marinus TaxID=872970 RepID=A0A1H8LM14_9BACI|nr:MerR family transcriptional regulator [Amphibacillus marinus]SEO06201.1 DNA-binding transcriptional regulator, MerR family [Amphibacillus marinus]